MTGGIKKILCIAGTRPEVVKMASVIQTLKAVPWADVHVVATGQHCELAAEAFAVFAIKPDVNLAVMTDNQTLPRLTSRLFHLLEPTIREGGADPILSPRREP